jgi:hypothetical protein
MLAEMPSCPVAFLYWFNCKKDIILEEDNNIINDQTELSEIFNIFFYKCS